MFRLSYLLMKRIPLSFEGSHHTLFFFPFFFLFLFLIAAEAAPVSCYVCTAKEE